MSQHILQKFDEIEKNDARIMIIAIGIFQEMPP